MISFGGTSGVTIFTLDPSIGEFVVTQDHVKIPKRGKIYSVNEGNWQKWDKATQAYDIYTCL